MASPSTGTSGLASEEDLHQQVLMEQKKRKRMISNRESARRSRMRKQKLLEDFTSQVEQLRKEKAHILQSLTATTHHYFAVEAENSILRTQMMELGSALLSLDDILRNISARIINIHYNYCDNIGTYHDEYTARCS